MRINTKKQLCWVIAAAATASLCCIPASVSLSLASSLSALNSPATLGAPHRQDLDEAFDLAVMLIRKATIPRADGEHHRLLRSLRQLRDPDLRPLYSNLSQNQDRTIRVNGIYGLAEVSPTGRVDPWQLGQLPVGSRRAALDGALSLDLAGDEELLAAAKWQDVEPSVEAYALWVLASRGREVDTDALTRLLEKGDHEMVRAAAALVLLHLGKPDGTQAALAALAAMPGVTREEPMLSLLKSMRLYPLPGAASWPASLVDVEEFGSSVRFEALYTLLKLAPEPGREAWRKAYSSSDGVAHRLRHALMLLDAAPLVAADSFDILVSESDELLKAIGRAGAAVAACSPAVEESIALIALRYPIACAWTFDHALKVKDVDAVPILAAIIEDTTVDGPAINDRLELAVLAADQLLARDGSRLRGCLEIARSRQRRLSEEAILAGCLRRPNPAALEVIKNLDSWPSTRAASMALLIKAWNDGPLNDDELKQLRFVFRGVGGVSSGMEIQAAWLYLKQTSQQGAALAAVLGEMSPDRPGNR